MRTILKIMLAFSILGVFMLLFLSQTLEPKKISISDITKDFLGEKVSVEGKIISLKQYNDKTFQVLIIKDSTGNITAIANSERGFRINNSINYTIIGEVQEYNNSLRISISKLMLSSQNKT